jgi:hypothetical protein
MRRDEPSVLLSDVYDVIKNFWHKSSNEWTEEEVQSAIEVLRYEKNQLK